LDLLTRIEKPVMWLTINRPTKANTLTAGLRDIFVQALHEADKSEDIRAVVLDATLGANFSGGIDLSNPLQLQPVALAELRALTIFDIVNAELAFKKPLIAIVKGRAIGGGCMLALLADSIICGPRASFSMPEIKLGIPSFIAAELATHRLGAAVAQQMVLLGRECNAEEFARYGSALTAPDDDTLDALVRDELRHLVHMPPVAFRELKAWMREPLKKSLAQAVAATLRRNALDASHAEMGAATASFA
jgi:enoyl-CoA hydratase